jgi:hypothetical protein
MKFFAVILVSLFVAAAHAGLLGNVGKGKAPAKGEKNAHSTLLPKLLPHEDTCYLLEFHSDNCDHCEQMEPVLRRLEDDLDTKIRRINIFRRREFMGLLEAIGFDECGGLPFYYNRRTGQAVCGATSYLNLKRWGTGDLSALFQDPPENMHEMEDTTARRDVGFKGFFTEKLKSLEKRGKAKAEKETVKKAAAKQVSKKSDGSDEKAAPKSAAERLAERRSARAAKKEKTSA